MIDITRNSKDIVKDTLLNELQLLLSECTEPQQLFFSKVFPTYPNMTEEKLHTAIGLCQRTLAKNRKGGVNHE